MLFVDSIKSLFEYSISLVQVYGFTLMTAWTEEILTRLKRNHVFFYFRPMGMLVNQMEDLEILCRMPAIKDTSHIELHCKNGHAYDDPLITNGFKDFGFDL